MHWKAASSQLCFFFPSHSEIRQCICNLFFLKIGEINKKLGPTGPI